MLHHLSAFWKVLCAVVGRPDLVAFTMRKLSLDNFGAKAGRIEDCACNRPEAVPFTLLCRFS